MPNTNPLMRMQNAHLPLYHHGIYTAAVTAVMRELMGEASVQGPIAVGTSAEVELRPGSSTVEFGTDMIAWYLDADLVAPSRMRVVCSPVAEAPLPMRRAAGGVGFAVFGNGPQLAGIRAGATEACRATGNRAGSYHVACFDGGLVVIDRDLQKDLPRGASPIALRDWMESHLGGYLALVRDREASPEATVQFLTGVDRIVKTLLPGYLTPQPDRLFDAALEGVRFLPSRHPAPKLSADISAA
ncbi:hypothetical protein [Mangrovicoccus sp. HB161399]|uniref:hypothetical protein n=1 Tax=Mangrovicoccus sp. HB161399 TaxID=2720392 RepID=UPI001557E67C|nr:hypothetical protein [Mangrovicoccus sp. HB161399]